MSHCDVVSTGKPQVWRDDGGWNCDQTTFCRTCKAVTQDRIAEDVTWEEAMRASVAGKPIEGGELVSDSASGGDR